MIVFQYWIITKDFLRNKCTKDEKHTKDIVDRKVSDTK